MLSLSSIMSTALFSSFIILLMQTALNKNAFLSKVELSVLLVVTHITAIRFLLPFDLPFIKNLIVKDIWPSIFIFLSDTEIRIAGYVISLSSILLTIWLTGIILLIFKEISSYCQLQTFIKNSALQQNSRQTAYIDSIICLYKKRISYRLYITDQNISPIICGLKTPCIILPQSCLKNNFWMYALEHEITHFFHGDLYLNFYHNIYFGTVTEIVEKDKAIKIYRKNKEISAHETNH